jgi:hypothetical protein
MKRKKELMKPKPDFFNYFNEQVHCLLMLLVPSLKVKDLLKVRIILSRKLLLHLHSIS